MVTVTATLPEPAGAVAWRVVLETRTTFAAGFDPNDTLAPPTNPVPVTETTVALAPEAGLMADTVGTAS